MHHSNGVSLARLRAKVAAFRFLGLSGFSVIPIAASAALLTLAPAAQAATDVWNNSTTTWETGSAWTPGGPPTSTIIASFDPTVVSADGIVRNPTITSAGDVAASLSLADTFLGGVNTFTGTGTLTLGSGGVTVRGFGTETISGPLLAGAAAGNLIFNIGNDAGLTLASTTTATTNSAAITIDGGTFTVDNSTSTTAKLNGNVVNLTSSGIFSLIGNAGGTTLNLGSLAAGNNTVSGLNIFTITPNGAATTINFANSGTFTTRPGTRGAYQFVATSGNLGDTNGARVTFTGTPFLGANGLLANTSGGGTFGYATVKDAGGVDFATWNATNGVVRAGATVTTTGSSTPSAFGTAADRTQFNPAASSTTTPSGAITPGSLRIAPAGTGATLAMGGNNITSNVLMLDGSNDFAITGTGIFANSGTRYIYVNNAATTLQMSQVVDSGANPTVFAGPGIIELTGTASQNTNTDTSRFSIAGGVVRGNDTEIGFAAGGNRGVISFGGGVLEIKNGSNGTGASADFTRALGSTAGSVTWGASGAEFGSGGFSAYGAAASVNIGGTATPATLTWGTTASFVADGFALRFGSVKSNAVLTFLNPIALDSGTAGAYTARVINVTAGTGGDRTVLSGTISGSSSTDLLKTGTGTLQLATGNTYNGRTIIEGGLISASGESAFGNNPGSFVANQIMLNGGGIQASTGNINFQSNRGIVVGNSGGTFDTNGNNITVSNTNPISGTGGLTKVGAGTLTLAATNTYAGTTAINGGTVLVTGSLTGAVNVSSGALGGTGTIGGAVIAATGGTISPGSSAGKLTLQTGLDLSGGGSYLWQLGTLKDDSTGTAGTDFDQVALTGGNLTLGGTSALTLDFSLLGGSDPNSGASFWQSSHTWIVIAGTGTTNTGSTNFSQITDPSYADGNFTIGTDASGDATLQFTAAPEPGSVCLLAFGAVGLFTRRRRA